jgi:hypothetical protein
VKALLARLLLSAALLLGLVSARAQSLYVHKELFQLCSQMSYEPLPDYFVPGVGGGATYHPRRLFVVDGVTTLGQPLNKP